MSPSAPHPSSLPVPAVGSGSSTAIRLPIPAEGRWLAEDYVASHFGHLVERRRPAAEARSSAVVRGGQTAADDALRHLTLSGYADRRRQAYPQPRRTVSRLSPWIRHGLLSLQRVWDSVEGGHPDDVARFRSSLLHQEYGRHLYARLGPRLHELADAIAPHVGGSGGNGAPGGRRQVDGGPATDLVGQPGWDRRMGCLDVPLDELEEDGWVVDEGRRWLAAHWLGRSGSSWRAAEEHFHRHLLDGSRAANRVAWLASQGLFGGRARAFSRWDVEALAPGLCASCELVYDCPIERGSAAADAGVAVELPAARSAGEPGAAAVELLFTDPDPGATAGPAESQSGAEPDLVWLTAESLGDDDPALAAHPGLPAVFVFDATLLARLRLSSGRLSFLVETLAELATRRSLELWLGDPVEVLSGRRLAATFTPVPGWRHRAAQLEVVARHPWPWLRRPIDGRIDTFDCWNGSFS